MRLNSFLEETGKGIVLRVRLTPNSSCCKIAGLFATAEAESFVKINVISVPEKGKANKELIAFLAKQLGLAKSSFEIVSGEADRYKKILISTKTEDIAAKIAEMIKES